MENPYEAVRAVLLERGWTKYAYEDRAGALCLVGAVRDVFSRNGGWTSLSMGTALTLRRIRAHTGRLCVSGWNDQPERTFTDVMDLLDECSRDWKRDGESL